jgi:hypothetical protein
MHADRNVYNTILSQVQYAMPITVSCLNVIPSYKLRIIEDALTMSSSIVFSDELSYLDFTHAIGAISDEDLAQHELSLKDSFSIKVLSNWLFGDHLADELSTALDWTGIACAVWKQLPVPAKKVNCYFLFLHYFTMCI